MCTLQNPPVLGIAACRFTLSAEYLYSERIDFLQTEIAQPGMIAGLIVVWTTFDIC
jgi:hypothetical protein